MVNSYIPVTVITAAVPAAPTLLNNKSMVTNLDENLNFQRNESVVDLYSKPRFK